MAQSPASSPGPCQREQNPHSHGGCKLASEISLEPARPLICVCFGPQTC